MSDQVLQWIGKGESETLEFKGARSPVDAIARSVCAMLNQQGGIVLWGVDDRGRVSGLSQPETKVQELTQHLMQCVSPRPLLSVSVHESGG